MSLLQLLLSNRAKHLGCRTGAGALNVSIAVQDMLSPLLSIVSPLLRPVNFSLLNSREKADTKVLIQTMAAAGLTFVPKAAIAPTVDTVPKWKQALQRTTADEERVYSLQP
jgi:hypothetical protein